MKGYILKRQYPIRLKASCGNTYLQIYENKNNKKTVVLIVKYESIGNKWKTIYRTKKFGRDVEFINNRWNLTKDYVLVLYEHKGPKRILKYEVLGCEDKGRIKSYVYKDDVMYGNIFFKGNALIHVMSNQYWIFRREGRKFILAPYEVPKIPGSKVIEYALEGRPGDESTYKVVSKKFKYTANVGRKIQIIRKDHLDIPGNMRVWSNNDCMKLLGIEDGYTIMSNCKARVSVQLTAGAYNWDAAREIKIRVK